MTPAPRSQTNLAARLDRASLWAIAGSVALLLQPFWSGGFRWGFFALLASIAAQIACSHWAERTSP